MLGAHGSLLRTEETPEMVSGFHCGGAGGEIDIPYDGVLYLRVNDSPAELKDNRGEIEVKLSLQSGN